MDLIKIGKFIAERRKACKLTQMQLAEQLGITDRAISKWETGRAMPDSSLMLELCQILKITVNDLLSGEVITMNDYNKQQEKHLLEMIEHKERSDRQLLSLEIVIGLLSCFILLSLTFIAAFVPMENWLRIVLIVMGFVPCLIGIAFALRIEQVAGYYECQKCGHRHVPAYWRVSMAMHLGRTRYMKCPACGKRSWNRKVLRKNEDK